MLNKYFTELAEKKQLTADVYSFKFRLKNGQKLDFTAGQYLILSIPQSQEEELKRLYSIASSADDKDSFELLVKIFPEGKAGIYLTNLNLGTEVIFTGPAGLFNLQQNKSNLFFLATGTGIAPILSILRTLSNRQPPITDRKITLYWGLPKLADVYLFDQLLKMTEKLPNFNFKICLSRENDLKGIREESKRFFSLGRINSVLTVIQDGDYYLCGSPAVVDSLKNELLQKGISLEKINFEKF